jgi:dienelactone hydrolase
MLGLRTLPTLLLAASLVSLASAQTKPKPDGSVVEPPKAYEYPAYAELPDWMKQTRSAESYALYAKSGPSITVLKYRSDGLDIKAFVAHPSGAADRLPVIVLNRGGVGEGAAIGIRNFYIIVEMRELAAMGYVVVASQYRGVDGALGRDEVGGADLNDVFNLLPVVRGLNRVDATRLFMLGFSRGGQMALQAARKGFPARAVAVVGAPTDWAEAQRVSPGLQQLARETWPDYESRSKEHSRERSAVEWAGEIKAPVLIAHGEDDQAVPVSQARTLARRLTEAKRPHELIVYEGDDHFVTKNREDRMRRVLSWFRSHDVGGAPSTQAAPVLVRARDFAFDMPASLPSGLVTLHFENNGAEPHYLRFMRIDEGKTVDDVLQWRASRTALPAWLKAAGGLGTVGPGRSVDFTTRLDPGRYVAMCGHPSPDGTFHADKGMTRLVEALSPSGAQTPVSTRTLELRDNAFAVDAPIAAGRHVFRVMNHGAATHQALLVKLPAGVSAETEMAWFRDGSRGPRPGQPVGGVIELAAGAEAWFAAGLEPGEYVLLCAIGSPTRHFDQGMQMRFTIPK